MKKEKEEEPEVYDLNKGKKSWELSRRNFLSGAAVAGAAFAAAGLQKKAEAETEAPFPNYKCPQVVAHKGPVNCLAFTSNGKFLISGSDDNKVKIWDVSKQGLIQVLSKHTSDVNELAVSPDGKWFITGDESDRVLVWDAVKGTLRKRFSRHAHNITGLGVTRDGNAVSVDSFGFIKYWRLPSGSLIQGWSADNSIYGLAVSPNGQYAATGHWEKIELWSLRQNDLGTMIAKFGDHKGSIEHLVFGEDNQTLATGSTGSAYLKIWSIPSGKLIRTINRAHLNKVYALAISPNGNFLASGGKNSFVKVWNFPSGSAKNRLSIRKVYATSLAISPDSTIVAVGQEDGKIRLCKLLTSDHLGCLMDIDVNPNTKGGTKYKYRDSSGRWITVTIPDSSCATPLPQGAVCVCNTVPGSCGCVGDTCSCVGYTCSCQGNCSCAGYSHYWYPN